MKKPIKKMIKISKTLHDKIRSRAYNSGKTIQTVVEEAIVKGLKK